MSNAVQSHAEMRRRAELLGFELQHFYGTAVQVRVEWEMAYVDREGRQVTRFTVELREDS